MPERIKGRDYDWAFDCNDCGQIFVFPTREERDRALQDGHQDHETDPYLQGRV